MLLKILVCSAIFLMFQCCAIAQSSPASVYQKIKDIEKRDATPGEKLKEELSLKDYYEKHHKTNDSVYAFILHRIALLKTKTESLFPEAIRLTLKSARINLSGRSDCDPAFAVNSLFNVGYYYEQLKNYKAALLYYDSAIQCQEKYPEQISFFYQSHIKRSLINYNLSNYQESLADAELGLKKREDSLNAVWISELYYRAAKAKVALINSKNVRPYIEKASYYFKKDKDDVMLSKCSLLYATLAAYAGDKTATSSYVKEAIAYIQYTPDDDDRAMALLEAGSIYFDILNDLQQSSHYFGQVIALHKSNGCNDAHAATAFNNLGFIFFKKGDINSALQYYHEATNLHLGKFAQPSLFGVPTMAQMRMLPRMNKLFTSLGNKAELLMLHYKKNKNPLYLSTAFKIFMVADSVITEMRYSQTGESSKLYWRKLTHEVHQHALEVCNLMNDPAAAFYFMERSRAVLLNDRLNELAASSLLHNSDLATEQELRSQVVEKQIASARFNESDDEYNNTQQAILAAQEKLNRYILSLEKKFPAYYQYKYATEVPSLPQLQQYLQKTNRQFIQYFVGDTCIYILYVNGLKTTLLNRSVKNMQDSIASFVHACSSKDAQNKSYSSFLQLSNRIYNGLFPPHNDSQPNSLIISPDHLLIPFDAFCTDTATGKMLLQDFAISYTYSARFLLKPPLTAENATGNFLGMAPAAFPAAMQLAPLPSSKQALQQLKEMYPGAELMTGEKATRKSLLQNMGAYTIVNLYTHAWADSNSAEPQLFLADSAIRLSEFQLIQHPATQLVVLSACQTNTGKLASGEGVYSIARGLAMAGIPSAVATIWKADEAATYFITTAFHKNLSNGMPKDKALQQAKLSWLQQHGREQALPYYWANSTLMGNADAITLKPVAKTPYGWLVTGAIALILVGVIAWRVRKAKSKSTSSH